MMIRTLKYLLVSLIAVVCFGFIPEGPASSRSQTSEVVVGLNVGDKAPELNYQNPSGKFIALSSLKGKVVLIDFWASWCGPCRFENPNLVHVFDKYKDKKFKNGKGFTVYGVSLDLNKARWEQAILGDGLKWESHVSDLKGWASEASKKYRVYAIPSNFLIDGEGIIIAKNLRGVALDNALEKFLAN